MDILEALADDAPTASTRRCKLGQLLDAIPEATPGKADLVQMIEARDASEEGYRPRYTGMKVLARLGITVSDKTFGDHRRRECRCVL